MRLRAHVYIGALSSADLETALTALANECDSGKATIKAIHRKAAELAKAATSAQARWTKRRQAEEKGAVETADVEVVEAEVRAPAVAEAKTERVVATSAKKGVAVAEKTASEHEAKGKAKRRS